MIRSICAVFTATLVASALCFLVLPPEIAQALDASRLGPVDGPAPVPESPHGDVGFLPSQYDFVFGLPELGVELKVLRVESGYLFWPAEEPSRWGFVGNEELDRIHFEPAQTGGEGISGRLTFEDALGATADYQLAGTLEADRTFYGTLSAPASGVSHAVELTWSEGAMQEVQAFGGDGTLRNQSADIVIIIVVSAAAIGTAGCLLLSWLEDCGGGCSDACGENGVDSYSEGYCGTCECDCNPPLET